MTAPAPARPNAYGGGLYGYGVYGGSPQLSDNWVDNSQVRTVVGGVVMLSKDGSLKVKNAIGQRSVAQFTIEDIAGTTLFRQGQSVSVINGGTKNLLTVNQSHPLVDLTGYSADGNGGVASIARDPSLWYVSPGAIRVTVDGTHSAQGMRVGLQHGSFYTAGAVLTCSCWLYGAGTLVIKFRHQSHEDVAVSAPLVLTTAWQRIVLTLTLPNTLVAGDNYGIYIHTNSNQAVTFWADAFQMEYDSAVSTWHKGQSLGGQLWFTGFVSSAKRLRLGYSGVFEDDIQCIDQHYQADKRIAATTYANWTCGQMFKDLVANYLAAEGVTYQRGVNLFPANASAVNADLTGFYITGTSVTAPGIGPVSNTGTTLTVDGSQFQGAATEWSVKVVTDGSQGQQGVTARLAGVSQLVPNAVYAVSGYIRASSGTPTIIYGVDSSAGTVTSTTGVLSTGWQRFTIIFQAPSSITATWYGFKVTTTGLNALTWWVDSLQFERVDPPTAWVAGGSGVNTILTNNQSNVETDTTGFGLLGGVTISRDTTTYVFGLASLKCVTPNVSAGEGWNAGAASGSFTTANWYTASAYLWGSGTVTLSFGQLGGAQVATSPVITLTGTPTRYSVTGQLTGALSGSYGITVTTNVQQGITFNADGLQIERVTSTAWELGGLVQSVYDGPTVISFIVPYVPVSKAIDELATLANFYWEIDQNKVAWFAPPTLTPGPFTFDGTQADYMAGASLEETNPLYRNSQWILNVKDVTTVQVETRKGDGTTRNFSFSYPFHAMPAVTLNGTSQSVGRKGSDDKTHSNHWYWQQGDPILAQETNDAILLTTDTLVATYVGEWTANINSQNPHQVITEAALEGGGSGLVEEAHTDAMITTSAQAFASAAALLSKYGQIGRELNFQTRWAGLAPGQSLPVNMSAGWLMSGVTALIEEVDISTNGPWWVFDVKAMIGPFNQTWIQYMNLLANPKVPLPGNAGSQGIVSITAPFTPVTWPWTTATFTPTVFACPICAATTIAGPSVIVC